MESTQRTRPTTKVSVTPKLFGKRVGRSPTLSVRRGKTYFLSWCRPATSGSIGNRIDLLLITGRESPVMDTCLDRAAACWIGYWGRAGRGGDEHRSADHRRSRSDGRIPLPSQARDRGTGASLAPSENDRIIDIGSGLGGPSRYLAKTFGCRVSGVDLTPEFVAAASALTARVGLAELVDFRVGSALDLTFKDASFDCAWSQNAAMNIAIGRVTMPRCTVCCARAGGWRSRMWRWATATLCSFR
jgi:Methyltransferase domain